MEAQSESRFLPCPFCGSLPVIRFQPHDIDDWCVQCEGCGAESCPEGIRYDRQKAIDDWNTRYADDKD